MKKSKKKLKKLVKYLREVGQPNLAEIIKRAGNK